MPAFAGMTGKNSGVAMIGIRLRAAGVAHHAGRHDRICALLPDKPETRQGGPTPCLTFVTRGTFVTQPNLDNFAQPRR